MFRLKAIQITTTVALLVLLIAAPALAVGKYIEKPFKGTAELLGVASLYDDPTGTYDMIVPVEGAAHITELSDSWVEGVLYRRTPVLPGPGYTIWDWDVTITASNGDRVYLSGSKNFYLVTPREYGYGIGTFEVTGGTGRFVGASGGGTLFEDVYFLLVPFNVKLVWTLDGTIVSNSAMRSQD